MPITSAAEYLPYRLACRLLFELWLRLELAEPYETVVKFDPDYP